MSAEVPGDRNDPLRADQAPAWWRKYQTARRDPETDLPERYKKAPKAMADLLAQPLLNYLVAILPDSGTATSINTLYAQLFDMLYARETATGRYHGQPVHSEVLADLGNEKFRETLEHIAVAAWHGGDRTVLLREIERFLTKIGRTDLSEAMGRVGTGLKTILNSFFVEARDRDQPDAFDFTHKSFREYLTACFITGFIKDLCDELGARRGRSIYTTDKAATDWMAVTSRGHWDMDLQGFFVAEIEEWAKRDRQGLVAAKDKLRAVFGDVVHHGLPVPPSADRIPTVLEWGANSEMAFVAALGGVHHALKPSRDPDGEGSKIPVAPGAQTEPDWLCFPTITGTPEPTAVQRLLTRLRSRARHHEDVLIWYAASLLDGARTSVGGQLVKGALGSSVATEHLQLSSPPSFGRPTLDETILPSPRPAVFSPGYLDATFGAERGLSAVRGALPPRPP